MARKEYKKDEIDRRQRAQSEKNKLAKKAKIKYKQEKAVVPLVEDTPRASNIVAEEKDKAQKQEVKMNSKVLFEQVTEEEPKYRPPPGTNLQDPVLG